MTIKNYGYNNNIIRIDLNKEKITHESPGESFYRTYLGGRALALYYLLKELSTNINPFDKDNILIFSTGVTTGAKFPGNSRFTIASKSPLTGGYGESECGGFWGAQLKHAGYDAIVIKGRAKTPSYIYIDDNNIEIRKADDIWGKDTAETEIILKDNLENKNLQVACIGQGGENLVKYASIHNKSKHVGGRLGMGAVMGSKNLKAIVINIKTNKQKIYDKKTILDKAKYFANNFKKNPVNNILNLLGTSSSVVALSNLGILPTKNFQSGQFELAENINGDRIHELMGVKNEVCYGCPVGCKKIIKYNKDGIVIKEEYGGPEYESIAALGSNCGIGDPVIVAKANERCNAYGIDTISTGNVIAFAMECGEKGIIKDEQYDLKFGNAEILLKLIDEIAFKKGLGNLLAEGVKNAAEKFGKEAKKIAVHVKGEESAMHEPRGKIAVGLGYAVGPKGADHLEAEHDECFNDIESQFLKSMNPIGMFEPLPTTRLDLKKVVQFKTLQLVWSLYMCLDICCFVGPPGRTFSFKDFVEIVNGVTGWDTTLYELLKVAERSLNMAKLFNLKCGKNIEDDSLPDRFFEKLTGNGPLVGENIEKDNFGKAVSQYYKLMGWDKKGFPSKEKIEELGLSELVS